MADKSDDLIISISTDLTTIKRQLRELGQSVTQSTSGVAKRFTDLGKDIDQSLTPIQKRINQMVGIPLPAKGIKEWKGALADVAKETDLVTRGFKLNRAGMMELQASGINAFQALASGMSLERVAMMEGAQVIGAVVQGTEGLGAKFAALLTPTNLVVTAIAAAGAAFVAYELSGTKSIESLDEMLKAHKATIELLGDAYDEVAVKQKKLAVISPDAFNFLNEGDTQKLKDKLKASISGIFAGATETQLSSSMGALTTETVVKSFFQPFAKAIQDLENSAKDTAALQQFVDTVIAFARANPQYTDAAVALLDLAQSTRKGSKVIADGALDVAQALSDATKPVDEFATVVNQFNEKMNSVSSEPLQKALQDIFDKAKDGKSSVDDINNAIAALEQANPSFSGIIDAIGDIIKQARGASQAVADIYANTGGGSPNGRHVNPIEIATEKAIQDAQYRGAQFTPSPAPNREDLGAAYDKALKKGHHAPRRTADDRFAEDIKSIQARTMALAQERGLLGATYEEQIKRNTAFDLEQKALKEVREEARRKGDQDWQNAQLSEDQKKKIDEVSDAYARQADALKKATDEMNFERDVLKGVFDDIRSALADGKISAKEWGDIFMGVLDKIIDKIENDLIDSILQASHAGGGSGLFGWLFGATGGGGGGGLSSIALKAVASGLGGLYADGGYTGAGSKNQPAGVVHRGEVVWSQSDIARAGGVGVVEALRRGVQMPNIAARRGADTAVHVTVGVAADGNGNLMPFVQSVAQTAAAQSTASLARRVPKMVDARNKTKQLRGTRA